MGVYSRILLAVLLFLACAATAMAGAEDSRCRFKIFADPSTVVFPNRPFIIYASNKIETDLISLNAFRGVYYILRSVCGECLGDAGNNGACSLTRERLTTAAQRHFRDFYLSRISRRNAFSDIQIQIKSDIDGRRFSSISEAPFQTVKLSRLLNRIESATNWPYPWAFARPVHVALLHPYSRKDYGEQSDDHTRPCLSANILIYVHFLFLLLGSASLYYSQFVFVENKNICLSILLYIIGGAFILYSTVRLGDLLPLVFDLRGIS